MNLTHHKELDLKQLSFSGLQDFVSETNKWLYTGNWQDNWTTGRKYTAGETLANLKMGIGDIKFVANTTNKVERYINNEEITALLNNAYEKKKKHKKSFEEGEINLGRYFAGDPECFDLQYKQKRAKGVRIAVDAGITANEDMAIFTKVAESAIIITNILSAYAIPTQVDAVFTGINTLHNTKYVVMNFPLKESTQKIDIAMLGIFEMPYLLRGVAFAAFKNLFQESARGGLGRDCIYAAESLFKDENGYDLIIHKNNCSEENITALIKQVLISRQIQTI
jgi:hypothetical protein